MNHPRFSLLFYVTITSYATTTKDKRKVLLLCFTWAKLFIWYCQAYQNSAVFVEIIRSLYFLLYIKIWWRLSSEAQSRKRNVERRTIWKSLPLDVIISSTFYAPFCYFFLARMRLFFSNSFSFSLTTKKVDPFLVMYWLSRHHNFVDAIELLASHWSRIDWSLIKIRFLLFLNESTSHILNDYWIWIFKYKTFATLSLFIFNERTLILW